MVKKIYILITLLLLAALVTTCAVQHNEPETNMKPSEVYVYSGPRATRAGVGAGYNIPVDGKYQVYYFIRIDGNIPGEEESNLPAREYFPRTASNKSVTSDLNLGSVQANVDWKSGKFSKYIYSKDGSSVQSIIVSEPTLEAIVEANKNVNDDFTGYLQHKDSLHFLWYICKQQDADKCWHIDGILTSKDRTRIEDTQYGTEINTNYVNMTPDEGNVVRSASVEIDVHQRYHKDWNEIKTSIHMRDTVAIEVFLPIEYQMLTDDFDIRAGIDYAYITELKESVITIDGVEYTFNAAIQHEEKGIRIYIEPNKDALIAARRVYGDGITFEVHNYVTNGVAHNIIWDHIKKTTYKVTPYTAVTGQITSAYYSDFITL